jgi:hypothetical protein
MQEPQRSVIDIEASGFGRHSYPIEVGFVRDDGQAWCSLVLPAGDWLHWDAQAERVHGISRAALQQHGRPVREVAQRLNDDLAGRIVYCDGWAHDYTWLALLFETAGLVPRFRLDSVNALLDEARLAQLDATRQQAFGVLGVGRHRASSDARALQWALQRLAA